MFDLSMLTEERLMAFLQSPEKRAAFTQQAEQAGIQPIDSSVLYQQMPELRIPQIPDTTDAQYQTIFQAAQAHADQKKQSEEAQKPKDAQKEAKSTSLGDALKVAADYQQTQTPAYHPQSLSSVNVGGRSGQVPVQPYLNPLEQAERPLTLGELLRG